MNVLDSNPITSYENSKAGSIFHPYGVDLQTLRHHWRSNLTRTWPDRRRVGNGIWNGETNDSGSPGRWPRPKQVKEI